jgi:Asp-tRNA(Asn)/Glu-tRNA(Gln) amidotransferase A subunit family amidase
LWALATASTLLLASADRASMADVHFRSATALAGAVRNGEISPVDLVESHLDRIAKRADVTNALVTTLEDEARERAREAERAVQAGDELGPLHGLPVAIKDLSDRKAGVPNTKGLKPLADDVAEETSAVVERLEAAGAVVVGTTNTPALGHKMRTDNELVGPTGTPFDPEYNAGGSSGGSAAALADGLVPLATGSDVGGSLRNPASCCGVVSVKPTFGLVPRYGRKNAFRGHTPFGVLGPMARTVADAGLLLDVLAGRDDRDPFSLPAPDADYAVAAADPPDPADLEIGFSPDLDRFAVERSVRETVAEAVDAVESAGATVERIAVEGPDGGTLTYSFGQAAAVYFATQVAELNEEHGFDLLSDHADDVQESLVSTVMSGQGYEAVEYATADGPRTEFYRAVEAALDGYDALAVPAMATPPLTHDEPLPTEIDGESVSGLPTDWSLAWPFNTTGHPVVTVPAGLVDGLPVGLQLVGDRLSEERLLGVAAAFERANPWSYPR